MKKIVLCTNEETLFDKEMTMFKSNSVNHEIVLLQLYKSDSLINKILKNINSFAINFSLRDETKKILKNSDIVIIFDTLAKKNLIKYIKRNNKNCRIIVYCRNKICDIKIKNFDLAFLTNNCEVWTYNKDDSICYNLRYNSQFWNINFLEKLNFDLKIKQMIFVGKLKNREKILIRLNEICEKNNYSTFFYLVPKTNFDFDKNTEDQYLDYITYLENASKSEVIIDLVGENNYGLTIRPLEALFLEKKLITNYKDIDKYDFYNPNNILIISDNVDKDEIIRFLNLNYVKIDEQIKKQYLFDSWINNFFEKK